MKKLLYYVITSGYKEGEGARRMRFIEPHLPDGVEVEVVQADDSPEFLDEESDFAIAKEAMYRYVANINPNEVDAVIISGALDPGLAEAREHATVPLIGPGEASLFVASIIGKPLSIITVDEHAVTATHRFLERATVKPPILGIRSTETPVRTVVQDRDRAREALKRECLEAVKKDEAGAIFLGCMIYSTLDGIADEIRAAVDVPVLDPLPIAIRTALGCINL